MKKMFYTLVTALSISLSSQAVASSQGTGMASYYGGYFHGRPTASGEIFNKHAMTTASNSHKMGTYLKVTNVANGKSVIVKVNDTGGFKKYKRVLDLSQGAFSKIASLSKGVIKVTYEVVPKP